MASLVLTILITSCGGGAEVSISETASSGDMAAIRTKKTELSKQLAGLEADIAILDSVINAQEKGRNLPLVTVLTTKTENFNHFVELQGVVATKQNVLIYPEVQGIIVSVKVKDGQKVNKGQSLAVIDDGGMGNQLAQMKTQLELAKTTFERQKSLWDRKIGSEIQFLQSKASYEAQKSAVAQMTSQLEKFTIRAPFAGIIDDVIKDEGNVVAPGSGSEVFRIVNLSNMYIEVDVPESHIANITKGKFVKMFIPVLNETVESKVRLTGNYINPNNRSFKVEIGIPNSTGKIKPNMSARVMVNDYTNKEGFLIPQSIISENAEGEQYVYVVGEIGKDKISTVSKKMVETGKTQSGSIEILSGLSVGQAVVMEGARSVKDGQDVKIQIK